MNESEVVDFFNIGIRFYLDFEDKRLSFTYNTKTEMIWRRVEHPIVSTYEIGM